MRDAHADGQWNATAIVARVDPLPTLPHQPNKETPAGEPAGVDGGQIALAVGVADREFNVPAAWKQEIASVGSRLAAELRRRLAVGRQDRQPQITPEPHGFQASSRTVTAVCPSDRPTAAGTSYKQVSHPIFPTNGNRRRRHP